MLSELSKLGFVNNIRSIATRSTITVSWSPPHLSHDQLFYLPTYLVQYRIDSDFHFEEYIDDTVIVLTGLRPSTFVLFQIMPEYQGIIGPAVSIGQATGNHCLYQWMLMEMSVNMLAYYSWSFQA